MAQNYTSAEVVRGLSAADINKLPNAQLKVALSTILAADKEEGPSNEELLTEIRNIRKELADIKEGKRDMKGGNGNMKGGKGNMGGGK